MSKLQFEENGYKVIQIDDDNYEVIKLQNNKVYHVCYSPIYCDCPAFKYQGHRCKHTLLIRPINKRNSNISEKTKIELNKGIEIANEFVKKIKNFCENIYIGGSISRKKPIVGDVDIAVIPSNLDILKKRLQTIGIIKAQGDKLTNLMFMQTQFNIFFSNFESWEPICLYATGSSSFNLKMRSEAKKLGYLLNQEGLWTNDKKELITTKEKEIFAKLALKYVIPENR